MTGSLPLVALRAFAETGRLGSMKAAAAALGVTPGAVSQQIKLLETRLGAALFERHNRELQLTAMGRKLLLPLVDGFDRIEAGWSSFERPSARRNRLTISATASFATAWLVPRLGRFTALHPGIELRIETTSRLVDLKRDDVDIALRHGLGDYPGYAAVRFLTPHLLPVCNPALLRGTRGRAAKPIRQPADCLAYPLLQDADRADWPLWLQAHGVRDSRASQGASFEGDLLLVQAALAGQGIALVRDIFCRAELASSSLVQVLDLDWPVSFAYYLVALPESLQHRKVAAFRDWLLGEAAYDAQLAEGIRAKRGPSRQGQSRTVGSSRLTVVTT